MPLQRLQAHIRIEAKHSGVNLGSSQSHLSRASKTHSQSEVDSNREYKIQRAALGDNPTKEEMDAVVAYGLEQHRKNFPRLYSVSGN